jgi:AcrR family transcriptional regulator
MASSVSSSRRYRKTKRAQGEEETRLRITKAAVELHRTRGPANTSIAEVAKLAGVSRMTVYNHFPTDVDLFTACSSHWATLNPFPAPARWATIDDPSERLIRALKEIYEWYGLKQDMLGKVFRDLPIVPALQTVMGGLWSTYVEELVRTLAHGWPAQKDELDAALRLVVDFNTWRILTGAGLSHVRAAELAARIVSVKQDAFGSVAAGDED